MSLNDSASAPIRDQRTAPRGVLPRQLQMWLMVGLAVLILLIILVTGHTEPPPSASAIRSADPSALAPDRIRAYQRQLADDEARLRQQLAESAVVPPAEAHVSPNVVRDKPAADPIADEQRRREYQSLFSDSVALSRRPAAASDGGRTGAQQTTPPVAQAVPVASLTDNPALDASRSARETGPIRSTDARDRLAEGTVIETVLINRIDGAFAGPVECLVTTPVYSHDRQRVVIPAGARVLGAAAPVQTWGDSRLAVSFHRLLMPDGRSYSLDQFKGLDQIGETGLRDQVNRHYLQVFGASVAIGALSGLAQYGTAGGFGPSTFGDEYRQAAGASLAASTGRVLDRYLNVLPTITIREGYRIKVYLTNDLELPAVTSGAEGGHR